MYLQTSQIAYGNLDSILWNDVIHKHEVITTKADWTTGPLELFLYLSKHYYTRHLCSCAGKDCFQTHWLKLYTSIKQRKQAPIREAHTALKTPSEKNKRIWLHVADGFMLVLLPAEL